MSTKHLFLPFLWLPICKTNHIDLSSYYFGIINFLTMSPTLQTGGLLVIGFWERCARMWLCALVNLESWQFTSVSLPLSLSHTLTNTHSLCFSMCPRTQGVYTSVCVCVCKEARDFFCVCISRAHCLDRENENGWDCNYWMEISTQCEIRKGWAKTSHRHSR